MGPTWGHLCHVGPRWAPCWPHDPCYQGGYIQGGVCGCLLTITVAVFTKQGWDHPLIILVWNSLRDLQRDIIERLCSSQEWNGLWFNKNPQLFVWPIFSTYSKLIAFISPPPPPPPPPKKKKKKKKKKQRFHPATDLPVVLEILPMGYVWQYLKYYLQINHTSET